MLDATKFEQNEMPIYVVVNSDEQERIINAEIAKARQVTGFVQRLAEHSKLDVSRLSKFNKSLKWYGYIQTVRDGDAAKLPLTSAKIRLKRAYFQICPVAAIATEVATILYDTYGPALLDANQTYIDGRQKIYDEMIKKNPEHLWPWLQELEPNDHRAAQAVEKINYQASVMYQHWDGRVYQDCVPDQVKEFTHGIRDGVRQYGDNIVVDTEHKNRTLASATAGLSDGEKIVLLGETDADCPSTLGEARTLNWLLGDSAVKYVAEELPNTETPLKVEAPESVAVIENPNPEVPQAQKTEVVETSSPQAPEAEETPVDIMSQKTRIRDYGKAPPAPEKKSGILDSYCRLRETREIEFGVAYGTEHGEIRFGVGGDPEVLFKRIRNKHETVYIPLPEYNETLKIRESANGVRAEIKGRGINITSSFWEGCLSGTAPLKKEIFGQVLSELARQREAAWEKSHGFIVAFEKRGLEKWNGEGRQNGREWFMRQVNQLYQETPDLKNLIPKSTLIEVCELHVVETAEPNDIQRWQPELRSEAGKALAEERLSETKEQACQSSGVLLSIFPISLENSVDEEEDCDDSLLDFSAASDDHATENDVDVNNQSDTDSDSASNTAQEETAAQKKPQKASAKELYEENRTLKVTQLFIDVFFDSLSCLIPNDYYRAHAAEIQQLRQICRNFAIAQNDPQRAMESLLRVFAHAFQLLFKDHAFLADIFMTGLDALSLYTTSLSDDPFALPFALMTNVLPRLSDAPNPTAPAAVSVNPVVVFFGEFFSRLYGNVASRYAILHGETLLRELAPLSEAMIGGVTNCILPIAVTYSAAATLLHLSETLHHRKISNILLERGIHIDLSSVQKNDQAKIFYHTWFAHLAEKNSIEHRDVPADGNCLFHAIAYYTPEDAMALRRLAGEYEAAHRDQFIDFFEGEVGFQRHLMQLNNPANVRDPNTWGGEVEIRALELALGRDIVVYNQMTGTLMRTDRPVVNPYQLKNPIFVAYHPDASHYQALLVRGESFCEVYFTKRLKEQTHILNTVIAESKTRCAVLSERIEQLDATIALRDDQSNTIDAHTERLQVNCRDMENKIHEQESRFHQRSVSPSLGHLANLNRNHPLLIWRHNAQRILTQQPQQVASRP